MKDQIRADMQNLFKRLSGKQEVNFRKSSIIWRTLVKKNMDTDFLQKSGKLRAEEQHPTRLNKNWRRYKMLVQEKWIYLKNSSN